MWLQVLIAGGLGRKRLALSHDRDIVVWNAHLSAYPYGPYDFCFDGLNKELALGREMEAGRTRQMKDIIDRMHDSLQRAETVPVLFM